jgi:phosphatidylinositol phospholipase C delta
VYHGKTLTRRVPLRDICNAINKYAFAVSPYPIIISAEVHCSVSQQDMIVSIMQEVFGNALVSAPVDGRPRIDVLPSPEDLKHRVLLKAKNLYITTSDGSVVAKEMTFDAESSSTTTTTATEDEDIVTGAVFFVVLRARS